MNNTEIFNIQKVIIPFSKDELENVINKNVMKGYIATTYSMLISTLENISTANEIEVTINPNTIYNNVNNPLIRNDVIIQVEGTQTFKEFINNVIKNDNDQEWTNFSTYSELFKDDVKTLKISAYKKFLWNYHNINNWFECKNVQILTDDKNTLITDFNEFKTRVLLTDDYISFIDSCLDEDIKKCLAYIRKGGKSLLTKYKVELNNHIMTNTKRTEQIILKNPIILKIFVSSAIAGMCKKDYPKLNFTSLDKKSFATIALWEK